MDFLVLVQSLTFEVRTDAIKCVSATATCLNESFIHLMPWMNHASLCCLCAGALPAVCSHVERRLGCSRCPPPSPTPLPLQ